MSNNLLRVQISKNFRPRILNHEIRKDTSGRIRSLLPFIELANEELVKIGHRQGAFNVQLSDEAPKEYCFRFDAPWERDNGGPLIPDPYALESDGFKTVRCNLVPQLPTWQERLSIIIWRGATTGLPILTSSNFNQLQRYQICQAGKQMRWFMDAAITDVVQTKNSFEKKIIEAKLQEENLLRKRLNPSYLALHKWLIDIDGNVNSWGLLWKLLSGCCVIKVSSSRKQWYHHKLIPGIHFIEVRADLSDLKAKANWCLHHPQECKKIAQHGQLLAQLIVKEMRQEQVKAIHSYSFF